MPLIAQIEFPEKIKLAFWQLDESPDALFHDLSLTAADVDEWKTLKHVKRKREWIASRAALRSGLNSKEEVLYLPNGKPYMAAQALSFSHCLPIAGALTHPTLAGFDIQSPDPKIEVIKTKFANPPELEAAEQSSSPLDYLTIIWSAKEAIFKVYGENLAFADEINIHPFNVGDRLLTATTTRKGKEHDHVLQVMKITSHWVVIAMRARP